MKRQVTLQLFAYTLCVAATGCAGRGVAPAVTATRAPAPVAPPQRKIRPDLLPPAPTKTLSVPAALSYAQKPGAKRVNWVIGLAYYKAKNYQKAANCFEIEARSSPQKPGPLFWLGYSYLAQGKTSAAEKAFVRLTQFDMAAAKKARIYLEIGVERYDRDKAGALDAYQKGAAIDPTYFNVNFGVGILRMQTGDWEGANRKLTHSASFCSTTAEKAAVFSALGNLWEKRSDGRADKQKARLFYDKSLRLNPQEEFALAGKRRLSRKP